MATHTFNCPACGAPLDYKGGPEITTHCPFCNNQVIVPPDVRRRPFNAAGSGSPRGVTMAVILSVAVVLILGGVAFAFMSAGPAAPDGGLPAARITITPPTPIPSPTTVPTPAFAMPGLSFGEQGIGPGQFNDARYLAVDGSGTLYVADYEDDRVQVFDSNGKYLSQFSVGDGQTIVHGLAADHQGQVYVAIGHDPEILKYDGQSGQPLGKLSLPNGGEFGELATTATGGLAATWYEGRWGLITSLEGHRDDLVLFDAQGQVALSIPSLISAQTGHLALDNYIAVDGLGTIFALSEGTVYVFSPQGKYLDKFDAGASSPGAICVDGQDRIYIGDSRVVHVFSADGRAIDDFPLQSSTDAMVVDEQGGLWVLGGDKVTQYTMSGR